MFPTFRTAVEIDDYLSALTPEERAKFQPTAHSDQIKAAFADAVADRERQLGRKARWTPHTGLPEWVRLGMYDVLLKWFEGKALTCVHRPVHTRPEPVFAAAWKPGVVVCIRCQPMLTVTGTVADTICDGCGHQCMGMPDDGIMPVSAFAGSLSYSFGVCVTCEKDMLRVEREANEKERRQDDG